MSTLFSQLWSNGGFWVGVGETLYMTVASTVMAYVLGLPLGVILVITDSDGLTPCVWLNRILGVVVNILRSIPFIILMVALIPFSRAILGTSIGNGAMILMLVVASAPYVARMVESSLKEVDKGVVEAARSMGANTFQIICKVYLPEAKPSLIVGAVISTVTILGYSAMSGTIAGGGLGSIAVTQARPSNAQDVIWLCVALMVVIVQVIQEMGMFVARKVDKRRRANKKIKQSKNDNSIDSDNNSGRSDADPNNSAGDTTATI